MAENVTPTRGKPVEDKANCSPFDLGVLFEELRQFSDQRKFELINNVWRPGSTFLFPKTKESGRNRRFNSSWLQDFPWLVYSRYLDGAFCLPCVLFARQCGRNSAKLDKLVKSPLTFWTTAFNRLSNTSRLTFVTPWAKSDWMDLPWCMYIETKTWILNNWSISLLRCTLEG